MESRIDGIDRDAFEPAYIQLVNILKKKIAEGYYRPGDQLPSESQLCRQYGVSPMTVRRSITLLAEENLISTYQGRGTFVKNIELKYATFDFSAFLNLLNSYPGAKIKLLDARIVPVDERTSAKLNIHSWENVIYIQRLLLHDDQPIFYHREYLLYDPRLPIVESEMDITNLKGLLSITDSSMLKRGDVKIEATIINEDEARILAIASPSAAFLIEHIFYDFDDRAVSWGWFILPSHLLHFSATLGATPQVEIEKAG